MATTSGPNASDDRYSHGHHESVLRSHRWRTAENSAAYLLPHLRPDHRLLDVGCGPGTITADLAARLTSGAVVGVDASDDVIEVARTDHVAENLVFETGDVYALGFPDDSFDVAHAHQMLQHLSDPVAALREMRRVTRPGGIVAARDSDYGAFVWTPTDSELTRWMAVYHEVTRRNRAEADAGRYLHRWAREAGFTDVAVSSSTWTFQRPEDREWWGGLWADRVLESEFARQSREYGLADADDLERMAAAFRRWAADPNGLFIVLHGEIVATA
jgi:ubiquinone/menaquinone biosynthesis C-methylase UbiE